MNKPPTGTAMAAAVIILIAGGLAAPAAAREGGSKPALVAAAPLRAVVNEASGELALQNEILLAGVNRNREPQEYRTGYFETAFLMGKLREYGITDAETIDLPTSTAATWDAVSAELWLMEPAAEKIADLKDVPACLTAGSAPADVTAGLVYVGPGDREDCYKGMDVAGKIVLVNGPPERARRLAVEKYGAAGIVAWSSSHPEFDRDQVGWSSIRAGEKDKPTFAFMVSARRGQDLRDALERGWKIVVRAAVRSQMVTGYKEQMVSALIRGTKRPDEELVFVAHLFEGFAKQGANDNISGCTAILETARVLKKLSDEGSIPALERSVRFLFVPEISGSAAYLRMFPDIRKRMFACINLDMVGEGLVRHLSWFRLTRTPWSLPSCLNDIVGSIVQWMGESQDAAQESGWRTDGILAPAGSHDPFYWRIDEYSAGSDHDVFDEGGVRIPAAYLNVWPDQWYHTSGDTTDKSDSTEFKRTVVICAASALFLTGAGPADVAGITAETFERGMGRLGADVRRASGYLEAADAASVSKSFREAANLVRQAVAREEEALGTAAFYGRGERGAGEAISSRLRALEAMKVAWLLDLESAYRTRCRDLGVRPEKPAGPTPDEVRLARLIPLRIERQADEASLAQMREVLKKLDYRPSPAVRQAEWELRNFINGRRSVLEIRDAVSAEFGPLDLREVEEWFKANEKLGTVVFRKT